MPKLRKIKQSNYTVIDNNIFKNRNLSLKAKGLLCLMLSLPDNWEYSLNGLVTLSTDGISSVRSALTELHEQGYFDRRRLYENGKLAGVEYIISETPMCENLILENLKQENLNLEKDAQLNKDNNKVKNKLNKYEDVPSDIRDVFMEWVEMRKAIKKPVTNKNTITRALNKLNKLASDTQEQRQIIEQSIDNCWQGFYPLKEKQKKIETYHEKEVEDAVQMPEELRANIEKIFA